MLSKIWILNLLLAAAVLFFADQAYKVWQGKDASALKPAAATTPAEKSTARPETKPVSRRMPPESTFEGIASHTLFSPERREFIPEEQEEETIVAPQKMSGKKIILYGVIIMGDHRKALISNPLRKSREEKQDLWVREGEVLGDLTVGEIRQESIIFKDGAKQYEIQLYDEERLRARAKLGSEADNGSDQQQPTVISATPEEEKPRNTSSSKEPGSTSSKQTQTQADEGYELVKTPFGTIKRKKK